MQLVPGSFRIKASPDTDPVTGTVHWKPAKSIWIGAMTTAALILGPMTFSWDALLVFFVLCAITLCAGHSVGIVGESGSGKTVTGLAVMGLIDPPGRVTGGRILFRGRDLAGLGAEAMRQLRGNRIAMVFQDPAATLNPVLTIATQLVEAVRAHAAVSLSSVTVMFFIDRADPLMRKILDNFRVIWHTKVPSPESPDWNSRESTCHASSTTRKRRASSG